MGFLFIFITSPTYFWYNRIIMVDAVAMSMFISNSVEGEEKLKNLLNDRHSNLLRQNCKELN